MFSMSELYSRVGYCRPDDFMTNSHRESDKLTARSAAHYDAAHTSIHAFEPTSLDKSLCGLETSLEGIDWEKQQVNRRSRRSTSLSISLVSCTLLSKWYGIL
jgi:hypothetical protein